MARILLLTLLLTAAPAGACMQAASSDEAGDVVLWPLPLGTPSGDDGPVDILAETLKVEDGTVTVTATLASSPPFGQTPTYRYWLGLLVGPNREYIDLRFHATTSYDRPVLVGSNEKGVPTYGEYDATWEDGTVTVQFPLDVLIPDYGANPTLMVGIANADGPHATDGPQGPFMGGYYLVDRLEDRQPLSECASPEQPPVALAGPTPARDSPGLAPMAFALALMALVLVRRTR